MRDRFLVANTLFYATPWSVLAVMGLFASWQLDPGRRSSFQIRLLRAAGLACGIVWGLTSWSFSDPPPASGSTVRVMTWNLGHGRRGLEQLAAEAAEFQPDLAVFVEADPARTDIRAVFRAAFPEHHVAILGGGIVLVSRWPGGEARAWQTGTETVESRIREVDLATPYGTWTVFACDLASSTVYQREPHVRDLVASIQKCQFPVIVAGDFNTPLDSVHLNQLRQLPLGEAFERSGRGYVATWPVPVPVLSLDQIWLSPGLTPVSCRRVWSWRTDHAAVIAEITRGPPDQPNRNESPPSGSAQEKIAPECLRAAIRIFTQPQGRITSQRRRARRLQPGGCAYRHDSGTASAWACCPPDWRGWCTSSRGRASLRRDAGAAGH